MGIYDYDLLPSANSSGNGISMGNTGLGFTNNTGSSLGGLRVPNNVADYLYKSRFESPLGNLGNLGNTNKTGGFFGNGNDLGMNFDTAKFGFGAVNSIFNILGAVEAIKAGKAQRRFAEENLRMGQLAYDDRVAFRGRSAAASRSDATRESVARAEADYLARYGTGRREGGLLERVALAPADKEREPVRSEA